MIEGKKKDIETRNRINPNHNDVSSLFPIIFRYVTFRFVVPLPVVIFFSSFLHTDVRKHCDECHENELACCYLCVVINRQNKNSPLKSHIGKIKRNNKMFVFIFSLVPLIFTYDFRQ